MALSKDANNLSRFFKDGRSKLPFPHSNYYPSTAGRLIQSFHNKLFDQLYPIKPWIFTTIWSASSAYFYLNGEKIPAIFTKGQYAYVTFGLTIAIIPVVVFRSILHLFLFRYKGHMFEDPKNTSFTTKLWGLCYVLWKKLAPNPGLLTCEALLPRQSVPPLKQSINRYLESMETLLSEPEFADLKQLARDFEANQGRKLQRYAWIYSWFSKNYITNFWEKYAYLAGRNNLLINSSICSGETLLPPKGSTQATRAGHCAYLTAISMLRYGSRNQPPLYEGLMSSAHYALLYANTRVPNKGLDYWTPKEYSRHLVVIHDGVFYKVDCFDPKTNKLYSVLDFIQIMDNILKNYQEPTELERRIAALTLDNRDKWAENRQKFFLQNPTNRKFIKTIESAIVVFVLDSHNYEYEPGNYETVSNLYKHMLLGNGTNRWVDKSIHYMFGQNAVCGAFTEHSVADGAEFVVAMEEVLGNDAVYLNYPKMSDEDFIPRKGLKLAQRLELEIFDEMPIEIERCFTAYQVLRSDVDFSSMVNINWGKGRIKKTNCSPDAFFQMAIQLAYYKDQGNFTLTYEAAAARFFKYTRTETIRTVSQASCDFVLAMLGGIIEVDNCARLLRIACEQHQQKSKIAMTGGGVDRHLFVLYILGKYLKVDSLFLDRYVESKFKLSTSQSPLVSNIMKEDLKPINYEQCYYGGAFASVENDGYGLCYRYIGNHGMVCHISAYHSASNTNSSKFKGLLEESLEEMIALFEVSA